MSDYVPVAKLSEIPDPGMELVEVSDRLVVVFHVDGNVYCLDDVCTHDQGTLADGTLSDKTIACPRHGAKFDVATGQALTMPATKATVAHHVRLEGDQVLVKVNDGTAEIPSTRLAPQSAAATTPAATTPTSTSALAASVESHQAASSPAKSTTTSVSDSPAGSSGEVAPAPLATGTELTEDHVREELKKVIDPELFVNIVDLGLIYAVQLSKNDAGNTDVAIDMTMTSPACPAGPQLIANSKNIVSQLPNIDHVEIKIVMDPPWTPDRMTDDARDQLGIF